MLSINELPDVAVVVILKQLLEYNRYAQISFKNNLKLLTICHQWRELALPLVCKNAFIVYGEMPDEEVDFNECDEPVTEPEDVKVFTNLELIKEAGFPNAIERMELEINYLVNPFPGLMRVMEILKKISTQFAVNHLQISIEPGIFVPMEDRIVPQELISVLSTASQEIADIFPRVMKLNFGGISYNMIARALYGQIAGHYANHLKYLYSNHPIEVSESCVFEELRTVFIDVNSNYEYQLPQINTEKLKSLRLSNLSCKHSWMSFSTGKNSNIIEFSNLEKLDLFYNSEDMSATVIPSMGMTRMGNIRLLFPKLNYLSVHSSTADCPVLTMSVFPNYVDSISIEGPGGIFELINEIRLPSAKSIELATGLCYGDSRTVYHMNQIMAKAEQCQVLSINIDDYHIPVTASDITCLSLTNICVSAPTSVSTLLALLEKLPHLTALVLRNITIGDTQDVIHIPEHSQHEQQPLTPFNTKMEFIVLKCKRHDSQSCRTMVSLVLYLLLRMPTLDRFVAPQAPQKLLLDKIDQFSKIYPHIENVDFRLNEESDWENDSNSDSS